MVVCPTTPDSVCRSSLILLFKHASVARQVVMFEPFFPWYPAIVRAAGGLPRFVKLSHENGFQIPVEETAHVFSNKTKMCIFNSPHNPTGHVATQDEMASLAELCVAHDVVCLSDEVYESCIFPSHSQSSGISTHLPMALQPGMAERTITVGSASKLLSVTGWRVGWAIAHSPQLLDITATMHSFNTFCAPTPLQYATAYAIDGLMQSPTTRRSAGNHLDISGVGETFERNAAALTAVLKEGQGLDVMPTQSGYFVVADVARTGTQAL